MERILSMVILKLTWCRNQTLKESLTHRNVGWKELLLLEGGLLECKNWASCYFVQLSFNLRMDFPQSLWIPIILPVLHCSPENVLYVQPELSA